MYWRRIFLVLVLVLGGFSAFAQTRTLRIVAYNIAADVNGKVALPGLIVPSAGGTVQQGGALEGIGEESVGGRPAQPIDVLALEETTSNTNTIDPIVDGMNAFYNTPGMYAHSTYQARESNNNPGVGNGPSAMVYNTLTVQLLASRPVDPPNGSLGSTTGEYREEVCYEFAPAGVTPNTTNEFYVYVGHYKANTDSGTTDPDLRALEAIIARNDEAANLPANARVLYVGDFNLENSAEACYQTIIAPSSPSGVAQGQAVDPFNVSGSTNVNFSINSLLSTKTDSSTSLHYRDDFQFMTTNIYNGTTGGLTLIAGSYHTFGNNGTTPYQKSTATNVNTVFNTSIPANAPITGSNVLLDLTTGSDHLPIVADYLLPLGVAAPSASFKVDTNNGAAPLTVTFTDTSSGSITNHSWTFGDGSTTNLTNTTIAHTYTNSGTYNVTEVVSSLGGSSTNTQAGYITVTALSAYQMWQLQYFGCTNCPQAQPGADADGTGQSNYFKFIAGLNPTNASSVFTLSAGPVNNGSNTSFTFGPVVTGRTYVPQFSTNIGGASTWQTLTTVMNPPVTNNAQVTVIDTNATSPAKFYRIEISQP